MWKINYDNFVFGLLLAFGLEKFLWVKCLRRAVGSGGAEAMKPGRGALPIGAVRASLSSVHTGIVCYESVGLPPFGRSPLRTAIGCGRTNAIKCNNIDKCIVTTCTKNQKVFSINEKTYIYTN